MSDKYLVFHIDITDELLAWDENNEFYTKEQLDEWTTFQNATGSELCIGLVINE